jgi:hypothetical protein
MPTYHTTRIGIFRSITDNGAPAKTYILFSKEVQGIGIIQRTLATEMDGWEKKRKFKDKYLFQNEIHFKLGSFVKINHCVMHFLAWYIKNHNDVHT